MTLVSKTIKINIEHEKWLESHPEINFSEWIREKLDNTIEKDKTSKRKIKAIIVAAGHDKRIEPLNEELPKCMLDVKGKTILERQIENLKSCGIDDIVIIKGYKHETINIPNAKYYFNPDFEETGIVSSLFVAENEMNTDFIFLYSDIIFDKKLLFKLINETSDICLVTDLDWRDRYKKRETQPYGEVELVEIKNNKIVRIGKKVKPEKAHAEFIGIALFSKNGGEKLKKCYKEALSKYKNKKFHEAKSINKAYFTDIMQELIDNNYEIKNLDIYGDWIEIDNFDDYKKAWIEIKT